MTINAVNRATFCVSITYIVWLWAVISSLSILGGYFAVMSIVVWFPYLSSIDAQISTPLILYFSVIFTALFACAAWITCFIFYFGDLSKREHYGPKTDQYRKVAMVTISFSFAIGIIAIIFHRDFITYIQNFILNGL